MTLPAAQNIRLEAVPAVNAVGAVALLGVGVIHTVDLPGTLSDSPIIGVGYIALIIASLIVAAALMFSADRRIWWAAGIVCAAAIGGYILSRTTGLPQDHDDIGNWLEPLGMAALFVEGAVVLLAGMVASLSAAPDTHLDLRAPATTSRSDRSTARL
jgi:hypothetical protein